MRVQDIWPVARNRFRHCVVTAVASFCVLIVSRQSGDAATLIQEGAIHGLAADSTFKLEVIARTGGTTPAGNTITALGWGPSINDAGSVAYKVRIADSREGVFVSGEPSSRSGLIDSFHSGFTTFSGLATNFYTDDAVQINNQGRVAWRVSSRDGLFSFIFRLGMAASDYRVVAKARYSRIDNLILEQLSPFCGPLLTPTTGLTPWVCLNNAGRVVFSGILADTDTHYVLATPCDADQVWSDYDSDFYLSPDVLNVANFYPQIADNGSIAVRGGRTATAPIILFRDPTLDVNNATWIATSTDNNALGERPGVSDDGRLVAFMADNKTQGVGIYFAVIDANKQLQAGPFKIKGTEKLSAFIEKARVGVNRSSSQDVVSRYSIVFLAFGEPKNGSPPGPLGLYHTVIDISDPAHPTNTPPRLVTGVGDTIPGLADPVQSIALYDPISNNGRLAYWVQTATGQAIIRASAASRELQGIEITQCVQNWNNDVPLIAGKKTYLVAHIWSSFKEDEVKPFELRLTFSGNGLTPETVTGKQTASYTAAISTAPPGYDRAKDRHSIIVPLATRWLHGDVTVTLEADELRPKLGFAGTITSEGNPQVSAHFDDKVPGIKIRPVLFTWRDGSRRQKLDYGDAIKTIATLYKTIPLGSMSFYVDGNPSQSLYDEVRVEDSGLMGKPLVEADMRRLCEKLERMRGKKPANIYYVGLLQGQLENPSTGLAGLAPNSFPWAVAYCPDSASSSEPLALAHEIGHTLGRHHARFTGSPQEGVTDSGFPYRPPITGKAYISSSDDQNANDTYYGLDVGTETMFSCSTPDIMSYGAHPWPSAYSYTNELNFILSTFTAPRVMSQDSMLSTASGASVFSVSGEVYASPVSGGVNRVTIQDASGYSTDASGNWTITLSDGLNGVLASNSCVPCYFGDDDGHGYFVAELPYEPTACRVDLRYDGVVVDSVTASANAPSVSLLELGGSLVTNNPIHVAWTAFDRDGDVLSFDVRFSGDNGTNWSTVVFGTTNCFADIDSGILPGTSQCLFRVVVSDGFHSAMDESSATLILPMKPPLVAIIAPAIDSCFAGAADIAFDAVAVDVKDGQLTASNIVWSSDRDGTLGTNASLYVSANSLSEGEHVITVDAVNSVGLHTTKSVTITVVRDANMNGLPDWWEQRYFGSATAANPGDDLDDDGMPNFQEYLADTDPTNGASVLAITGLQLTPSGLQIGWKGGTGVWQYLESRQNLLSTSEQWTAIFSNPPPTALATNIIRSGVTNPLLYYRLKTVR